KGINSIGVPLEGGMLYRYSVHPRATSLFADVALAAEAMKDDEFWSALLRSFPGKERKDFQPLKEGETGRLAFTELKSEDSKYASFAYVLLTSGPNRVAIVFRVERGLANDKNIEQIRKWSLGTLVVGSEAARLHKAVQEKKKQAMAKRRESSDGGP